MKDRKGQMNKMNSNSVTPQPAKRWVKLPQYCKDTGDTRDAVHARRKKGIWLDGVHTCLGPNNRVYVCPDEAARWVESRMGVMQ